MVWQTRGESGLASVGYGFLPAFWGFLSGGARRCFTNELIVPSSDTFVILGIQVLLMSNNSILHCDTTGKVGEMATRHSWQALQRDGQVPVLRGLHLPISSLGHQPHTQDTSPMPRPYSCSSSHRSFVPPVESRLHPTALCSPAGPGMSSGQPSPLAPFTPFQHISGSTQACWGRLPRAAKSLQSLVYP